MAKEAPRTNTVELSCADWVRLREWPYLPRVRRKVTLVDVFCGCGGLTLGVWEGLRRCGLGLEIKLAVDISRPALEVYRANFDVSDKVAREEDVTKLLPGDLGTPLSTREQCWRGRIGALDLLVAGPPCQGHSDLNNSTRRDDPRNALYLRAVRAVEVLRPKAALIENVPAVVHDSGRVVQKAIDTLTAMGYRTSTGVVDASRLGLPQKRRRHLLVALRGGAFDLDDLLPTTNGKPVPISAFIDDLQDEPEQGESLFCRPSRMTSANLERVRILFSKRLHDLPDKHRPPCHRDKEHSYASMYGRMHWDREAQTITSGFGSMGQGRFVHPTRRRMLTPHEAARLQGFPDFFDFSMVDSRTALNDMIGNAVPPCVSATIATSVFMSHPGLSQERDQCREFQRPFSP